MSVWLPFCMNKHTNIFLWLTEKGTEPFYIKSWLIVVSNNAYKMSLWLTEKLKNRHILGVLLG